MSKWVSKFMRVSQDMYNVSHAMAHVAFSLEVAERNGDTDEVIELTGRYSELMVEMKEYEAELKVLIKERRHA